MGGPMNTLDRRAAAIVAGLLIAGACTQAGPLGPTAPTTPSQPTATFTGTAPTPTATDIATATPDAMPTASPAAAAQALSPDPSAEHTVGDTIRLSGGEFVGDQADLYVMEAVMLQAAPGGSAPMYAFLVEITGLDPEVFPYNLRDFSLFDDQSFEYQPLSSGGQEPRLEFGDLIPNRKVRGWLTFEGPADSAYVELQYFPALALEPALVRVLVP